MSLKTLDGVQPELAPYWQYAFDVMQLLTGGTQDVRGKIVGGVRPTITSTYRTIDEQADLYARRETNPYPVNRPGDSAHNWGLAVDSDVPDRYMPLWIDVRRYVGFRVPDNDEVHGELPDWRSVVRQAGYKLPG